MTAESERWVIPAFALALAAAVSLGLARFSYALLLPPMREDLAWSYATAGAMNTVNAAGYLLGALVAPQALARLDARRWMLAGSFGAAALLAAHGLVRSDAALYLARFALGVASAASFVGGGLLAARLAQRVPAHAGLVLGIYYGGVGIGIVASALALPPVVADAAARWPWAWGALGGLALLCAVLSARGSESLAAPPAAAAARAPFAWQGFVFALASYLMFGFGYIGYMTFIVTLLREQGMRDGTIVAFYVLIGLGVVASSWLWAGLLQRQRGGVPLVVLNALLALATLLPVVLHHPAAVFVSGALFGAVFLSVVASTTAIVRHNAEPAAWPTGIALFTIVFAAGQIVGPTLVGLIADGEGGLARGLAVSAAALALGSVIALAQKPVRR